MSGSKAKQFYKNISLETASPGNVILILFDAAIQFIQQAKAGFDEPNTRKSYEAINNNVLRAVRIILELRAALDFGVEGKFSQTMADLYAYMEELLIAANTKKEIEPILEAEKHLVAIRDAWAEMLGKNETPPDNIDTTLSCSA